MDSRRGPQGFGRTRPVSPEMARRGIVPDDIDPRERERAEQMARGRDDRRDERHREDDRRDDRRDGRYSGGRYGDDRYTESRLSRACTYFANVGRRQSGGYDRSQPGGHYQYHSLGGVGSAYDSLLPPIAEKEIDEQYQLREAYTKAAGTVEEIARQIEFRIGSIGAAINDAMELFKHPRGMKKEDPIFANFISDLKLQGSKYITGVSDIIGAALVDIIGQREFRGGGRMPAEEFFSRLDFITLRVLLLEFGNWLEQYPDSWILLSRMSPQALSLLSDERDAMVDMFTETIREVSLHCGGSGAVDSLWNKNLLDNIRRHQPSRSPTYDSYLAAMDYDFGEIHTPHVLNTYDDPPIHKGEDWDPIMAAAMRNMSSGETRRSVNEELTKMTQETSYQSNWSGTSWGDTSFVESEPTQEKIVTLSNLHEFTLTEVDPTQWFKPIPGHEGDYVISPSDFSVLSQVLNYRGKQDTGYRLWDSYTLNKLPVVRLNWAESAYDYVLVDVNDDEEMEMILTNPEKVIPKLSVQTEEEAIAEHHAEVALKELESRQKEDPNKVHELDGVPKIVHANVTYVFEERKRMTSVLDSLHNRANELSKDKVSATVLPVVDCAEMKFEGISHHDVISLLPQLVEGSPLKHNLVDFAENLEQCLNAKEMSQPRNNWRGVKDMLNRHLATIVNRWLVEERYFAPYLGEQRHLSIKDFFGGHKDLLDFLEKHDPDTYHRLYKLSTNDFLVQGFQLFADSTTAMAYANKDASCVDESLRESVRNRILTENVIVATKGMVVQFSDLPAINANGPKLIQRSSSPEMFHAMDKARTRSGKCFKKEKPVYFTFHRDSGATVWALTLSPVSEDKAVIVPIGFEKSLATRTTIVSEAAFRN